MPFPPDVAMKIRERLDGGILHREEPVRMYAGRGAGQRCDGCERPIFPSQVHYTFVASDERAITFHRVCAELWQTYRRRHGQNRRGGRSGLGPAASSSGAPHGVGVGRFRLWRRITDRFRIDRRWLAAGIGVGLIAGVVASSVVPAILEIMEDGLLP
jgi:hypothetical protein